MALTEEERRELTTIEGQLEDADSDTRRWAVYDLEKYPAEDILDYLITATKDEHRAVREAASEVLESVPTAVSISKLTPLLGHARIEVRNLVAALISKFGVEATPALIKALKEGNEDERKFSADILGLAHSELAVDSLATALYDEVENVGVSAAEALGKIRSAKALPHLQTAFETKKYLMRESAEAIGLIGEPEGARYLLGKLADTTDLLVQYAMIDALGNAGDMHVLEYLEEHIGELPKPLRDAATLSMLKISQRTGTNLLSRAGAPIEALVAGLEDSSEEYQQLLIDHIDGALDVRVLQQLTQARERMNPHVLVALIKAVTDQPGLAEFCLKMVDHADDWVAYSAVEQLPKLGQKKAAEVIKRVLEGDRNLPQLAAMRVVQELGVEEALEWVKPFLESDDEDLRSLAGQVLDL